MKKIVKLMNVVLPGIRLPVRHDTLVLIALTCWITVLVLTSASQAADIYVDGCATGNEDGTATHPYHTLTSAHAAAAPNDSIIIKGGLYREILTINTKLTITAYDGSALVGVNKYNVGWRDIIIDLSSGISTNARVYYPSCANGEQTQIASPLRQGEKFPAVVYVHGQRLDWPLCGGWGENPGPPEEDYLQAEGILTRLASSGIIALSFNWKGLTGNESKRVEFVIDVITYMRNEFVDSINPQNMGLIETVAE